MALPQRLAEISTELDALPPAVKRYAYPPAGTYNCRAVADTGQPSMHAWGAAIDINTATCRVLALGARRGDQHRAGQPPTGRDRRNFRAARLHLGRKVVPLRHDAFRIPAGAGQRPAWRGRMRPGRRADEGFAPPCQMARRLPRKPERAPTTSDETAMSSLDPSPTRTRSSARSCSASRPSRWSARRPTGTGRATS